MIKAKPTKEPLLDADAGNSTEGKKWSQTPILNAEIEIDEAAFAKALRDDDEDEDAREEKRGHKLFFVCCDTKRAVVWLNTAVLLLNVFTLTGALVRRDEWTEGYQQALIVRVCGMCVTLATLFGAYSYSKSVVLVGLAFTAYRLTVAVLGVAQHDWRGGDNEKTELQVLLPLLGNVLLFYAEAMFVLEVNDGIMSKETYKSREKYVCCCSW